VYKCIRGAYKWTILVHEKNDFTKVFINLARYRSEINFVWTIKIIMYDAQA